MLLLVAGLAMFGYWVQPSRYIAIGYLAPSLMSGSPVAWDNNENIRLSSEADALLSDDTLKGALINGGPGIGQWSIDRYASRLHVRTILSTHLVEISCEADSRINAIDGVNALLAQAVGTSSRSMIVAQAGGVQPRRSPIYLLPGVIIGLLVLFAQNERR
jgi:hypothetical protein